MTMAISRWTPPADVVAHTGEPVPADALFFVAPPPEIGEIYSAYSGIQGEKRAGSGLGSMIKIALVALIGVAIGAFLLGALSGWLPAAMAVGGVLLGAAFGYFMFRSEAKKNNVSYTGSLGIARFWYDNDATKREKGEIFLFANAVELRTGQTRHYTNGIYSGTEYFFTWTGRDGKQVFRLGGRYSSQKGTPKPHDPFYYARAAELAWSRYLLQFVNAELERSGAFRFNLRGNNCVVAGPGFLDLYMGGQQIRCPVDEIDKMEMNQGVITVRRKDAKSGFLGIGSTGIFRFTYSELANGRVFLMLLDQLVGVQ
jgi:hypothetical protein